MGPMDNVPFAPLFVRDPRLAPYVTSVQPVWLWSAKDARVIWSNASGAAVFGAATVKDLITRVIDPDDMAAAEIARLAESLNYGGAPRLERLRGFGAGVFRLPVCACSRITFKDQMPAVLVVGTEALGPELPLVERIRRLFDGTDQAIAVFSPDGSLAYATVGGHEQLGGVRKLADLGAEALAQEALRTGWSTGTLTCGRVILDRIGTGANALVYVTFAVPAPTSEPARGTAPHNAALPDNDHPLRFGWHMDANGLFTLASTELFELIGTAARQSRLWSEINADLALDPDDAIATAIAALRTLSAIAISWPLEGGRERLNIELSGLPIYDRERRFLGYRGFGVCRDVRRATEIAPTRQPAARTAEPVTHLVEDARPPLVLVANGQNVVPFRATTPAADKVVGLSVVEHKAFSEIGRQLSARLDATELAGADLARERAGSLSDERATAQPETTETPTADAPAAREADDAHALLDHLPYGVLIYGADAVYYANAEFLASIDCLNIAAFKDGGGLDTVSISPRAGATADVQSVCIKTAAGDERCFDAHLLTISWAGATAHALVMIKPDPSTQARVRELERELIEARQRLDDRTAVHPSAMASGEIRTALDAIVGSSEAMLQESFGPIGNERYRTYVSDICTAGRRVLASLAKLAEAPGTRLGNRDAKTVPLNEMVQSCVTQFQPEANRSNILIRMSLFPAPIIVSADADVVRDLVADLLNYAIKATKPGGQIIVSTASAMDANGNPGGTTLRVRIAGGGVNDAHLVAPLNSQITPASGPGNADSTLVSAKTRAEAIGATFAIASGANHSTLVTITFPARLLPRAQPVTI
jgi:signal transduction histidine kinase